MGEIKTITENGFTLRHWWYYDWMGLQRNSCEISWIREDGMKMIKPLFAPPRVRIITRGTAIMGDDISPYKDEEYAQMLKEEVTKVTNLTRER